MMVNNYSKSCGYYVEIDGSGMCVGVNGECGVYRNCILRSLGSKEREAQMRECHHGKHLRSLGVGSLRDLIGEQVEALVIGLEDIA